jgi:hypothetical protein
LLKTPETKLPTIDTATTTSRETSTTTTTATPTPTTNTAVRTIYETTATPKRLDRVTDTRHVIATPAVLPTQLEHKVATTIATATDPDNAITTAKQQDNEGQAVGREEEERGVEKRDRANKWKAE